MGILGFAPLLRPSFSTVPRAQTWLSPMESLSIPYTLLPPPGPWAPCSQVLTNAREVLWGGLRYLKKNSCLNQALFQLVVAVSSVSTGAGAWAASH